MRVKSIAMLDIETSGMDASNSEIIFANATILHANGSITVFTEYAKPAKLLDKIVENLTGITNEMLEDKKSSSSVKRELIRLIQDCIVIGTNKEYLESFLGIRLINFVDARELMKIELVSNHTRELQDLATKIDNTNSAMEVQKTLEIPYGEASIIAEVLNAMRGGIR